MLKPEDLFRMVQEICGKAEIDFDTTFSELGLDSTNIVEILIEIEMILDKDVLDAELNLDSFITIKDVYDYVKRLF
jgi:acyl carrier protein